MVDIGNTLTNRVTKPLLAIATASAYVGMGFEASMSKVEAVTGATAKEMEMLEETARKWGAETVFTASQVADGMYYMGLSGWDTMQIYEGLPGVLHLAASAGLDLGHASDIVTNAITAFGLSAADAGRFADVLATTNKSANTSVDQLGEAFKYVAPIAGAMGYEIEDVAVALAMMANAGVQGSQAGTTLRRALLDLTDPTDATADEMERLGIKMFEADGTARPLEKVLEDLRKALSGLDEEQQMASASTLFATTSIAGMLAVVNASDDDFYGLINNLENAEGNAKKFADIMQDNLKGELIQLKSKLEEAGITIYQNLLPALSDSVKFLQNMVDKFLALDPATQKNIVKIAAYAAAIGPLLVIGGKTLIMFGKMKAALTILAGAKGTATVAGGKLGVVLGAKGIAGAAGTASASLGAKGLAGMAGKAATAILGIKAAPIIAVGAGVATAGYVVKKTMDEEVIPAMDLFKSELRLAEDGTVEFHGTVSEETQKVVGAFMDMSLGVGSEITTMWASQQQITDDNIDELNTKYDNMSNMVIEHIETQKNETLELTHQALVGMNEITDEEQSKILTLIEDHHNDIAEKQRELDRRRKEILENGFDEEGRLTDTAYKELMALQDDYQSQAIESLSANEIEQTVIANNLKNSKERINAEMLSDAVTSINQLRDDTVSIAEQERDDRIRVAEELKRTGGSEAEELANKMIDEANRMYNETVEAANKQRDEGVKMLAGEYKDLENTVNLETGNILTNWDKLKNWWENWTPKQKVFSFVQNISENISKSISTPDANNLPTSKRQAISNNANGTWNWQGGLTWVNERGPELLNLPQGTSIIPSPLSSLMMQEYGREVARSESKYQPVQVIQNEMNFNSNNTTVENLLRALLHKDQSIVLDGQVIGSTVDHHLGATTKRMRYMGGV